MLQSSLTGEMFDEKDAIRIINPKQAAFYWATGGIKPYSIYPSKDFNTGDPIVVFLFSKEKTGDIYKEWLKQKH